ncbi:uncharacterized protein J3D65DRAFT_685133 [Phyllosticta citribraziliensis]|uniref:RING-type domain-containing protein n=1 Tax=Phyllosticta citribraziliensis TaxID=989973 RepID=A0ABR1L9N3_9PEZI
MSRRGEDVLCKGAPYSNSDVAQISQSGKASSRRVVAFVAQLATTAPQHHLIGKISPSSNRTRSIAQFLFFHLDTVSSISSSFLSVPELLLIFTEQLPRPFSSNMATSLDKASQLTMSIACWIKLGSQEGLKPQQFCSWVETIVEECVGLQSCSTSSSTSKTAANAASPVAVMDDCHAAAPKIYNLVACLTDEKSTNVADTVSTHLDRAFDDLRRASCTLTQQGLEEFRTSNAPRMLSGCIFLEILFEVSRVFEVGRLAWQYFERAAEADVVSGLVELLDVRPYEQRLSATRGPGSVACGVCKQSAELSIVVRDGQRLIEPRAWAENNDFDEGLADWDMVPRAGHGESGGLGDSAIALRGSDTASLSDSDEDDFAIVELGSDFGAFSLVKTRCGHLFCAECLEASTELSARCPVCGKLL